MDLRQVHQHPFFLCVCATGGDAGVPVAAIAAACIVVIVVVTAVVIWCIYRQKKV